MKRFYFTFGHEIDNPHRNCYHVEVAEDYIKAREQMIDKFGIDWAFQYSEDEWLISRENYQKYIEMGRCFTPWHDGFTQAEMFNLIEI